MFKVIQAIEAIRAANSKAALQSALSGGLENMGFCSYSFAHGKKSLEEIILDPDLCSRPDEFMKEYERQGWIRKSPLVSQLIKSAGGFSWSLSTDVTAPGYHAFSEFLTSAGIHSGIIVPLSFGQNLSSISVEANTPHQFSPEQVQKVAVIANAAALKSELLGTSSASAKADENLALRVLTVRQVEILK